MVLSLVRAVRDLYESERHLGRDELDIYIDLNRRSVGLTLLMQEFLELPWNESFSNVRLTLQPDGAAGAEAAPVPPDAAGAIATTCSPTRTSTPTG